MRLDHIAFRVVDRVATSKFLMEAFGYRIQDQFRIPFDDGTFADCIALEPGEKHPSRAGLVDDAFPWKWFAQSMTGSELQEYHMPPEIFVSDGKPGSIVAEWVAAHNGVGGIHHMAFQVEDVDKTMQEWKEKGWLEFTSKNPMRCEDLTQVFSKPQTILGGVIIEFIKRGEHGFCKDNVKALMESTKNLK